MNKITYNFREYELGPDFAKAKVKEFQDLIETGISFTVVSMPGVGVSFLLKYLTGKDFATFVHIDLYSLPTISQHEFYKLLLTELGGKPENQSDEELFLESKKRVAELAKNGTKLVLIFSRFDSMHKAFDTNFLSNIQALSTIVPNQIVLIFTAIKPLEELVPEAITGGNLAFYSKVVYFTPFAKDDLKALFILDHTSKFHPELDKSITDSGGHNQLLHIFINSHKKQNLLLDKFVKLQLRDLFDYLDYDQKKQLQNISLGKNVADLDEYLLGVGYIRQSTSEVKKMGLHLGGVKAQIFSPILAEYIKTNIPHKLPVKERALFKLLRDNSGKVVSKDEIFSKLWPDNPEKGTDWALDALIYRLRKSSFMKAHGYIIESYKKVGYELVKI